MNHNIQHHRRLNKYDIERIVEVSGSVMINVKFNRKNNYYSGFFNSMCRYYFRYLGLEYYSFNPLVNNFNTLNLDNIENYTNFEFTLNFNQTTRKCQSVIKINGQGFFTNQIDF